jgi:hypothetical protein
VSDSLVAQTLPLYTTMLRAEQLQDPRTLQTKASKIGPSDIGFCRQKVLLMLKGVEATDSKDTWAAEVGKAIHTRLLGQFKSADPARFLTEDADTERLTVSINLGEGISIVNPGHPDLVDLVLNAVIDIKTVDGLGVVRRHGASTSQRFQRWLYCKGLIDAGVLDGSKPVYHANLWFDRSGADSNPVMEIEEFDDLLGFQIEQWISDVIYARTHNEDASRDVASPVCEAICEFFTVCRGGLPDQEAELLDDPQIINAMHAFIEGRDQENAGKALRSDAKKALVGISGICDGMQIRWTHVNETDSRAGSSRLDVRPAR